MEDNAKLKARTFILGVIVVVLILTNLYTMLSLSTAQVNAEFWKNFARVESGLVDSAQEGWTQCIKINNDLMNLLDGTPAVPELPSRSPNSES